jgi:hypothetical protein
MRSNRQDVLEFIDWLTAENYLSERDCVLAFSSIDEMNEMINDDVPISVYEELGDYLGKARDKGTLVSMLTRLTEVLIKFAGERYFFVERLVVSAERRFDKAELLQIIAAAPEEFRGYLEKRLSI